jgi:hypothetical protein
MRALSFSVRGSFSMALPQASQSSRAYSGL